VAGDTITATLPYPPSMNHYWRRVGAKTLISREGRAYRKHVEALLLSRDQVEGRLSVSIKLYPPDKRRRDLDNIQKPLLDALEHARLIRDDGDIDRLLTERCDVDRANPRVELTIEQENADE